MKKFILVPIALVVLGALVFIVIGFMSPAYERVDVTVDGMRVIIPAGKGKLPVVFFAHNGNQTKEDWGDYPEELTGKGYAVVNMGWTDFKGAADFRKNFDTVSERWGNRLDLKRTAFVGGCHGGIKMLGALEAKLPLTVKALVFLSMSEQYSPPAKHAPILGIYSLKDHLGEGYVNTQKKVYESVLNDPKTVIALDATPHGDELVTDQSTRDRVRAEIDSWLKKYL